MSDVDNPYLPPKAVVADVPDDSPRIRPTPVNVALVLIGARVLFGISVLLYTKRSVLESTPLYLAVMATFYVGVAFTLGFFIARGRNWARILYLVLTIFAVASFSLSILSALNPPPGVVYATDLSPMWFVTVVVPQALSISVVVLLFGPGRAWFRARG